VNGENAHQGKETCLRGLKEAFAAKGGADKKKGQKQPMSYSRYDDIAYGRRNDWGRRLDRSLERGRGFAWGAFVIGLILGAIIF